MAYFFRADGSVNLWRLTASTSMFVSLYASTFLINVAQVKDPGMDPTLQAYSQVYEAQKVPGLTERILGFFLADRVLYGKLKVLPNQ